MLARTEPRALAPNQVLFGQARRIEVVHFPITAVVSLVNFLQSGAAIEVCTIGKEGMTGASVLLGPGLMPNATCFSQIPGEAIVMRSPDFRDEVAANSEFRDVCLRHVSVLITQLTQRVACSRLHTVQQRCARWLLLTRDRVGSEQFPLTHEFLGYMLGSRRASVSETLSTLNRDGLIRTRRGMIEIIDAPGLEARSCECYAVIRDAIGSRPAPARLSAAH